MANTTSQEHIESVGVDTHAAELHTEPSLMSPDVTMMIMTWITFFGLLTVLTKFAWKPILAALEDREKKIQQSIDDAEKTSEEYQRLQEIKDQMIADAHKEAAKVIEDSRQKAQKAADLIQEKANQQADELLLKTEKKIQNQVEQAIAELKKEQISLTIQLASELMRKNLDDQSNRDLVDQLIKEIN